MQKVPIGLVSPKWVKLGNLNDGKLNDGKFRRKIAVCDSNCHCTYPTP